MPKYRRTFHLPFSPGATSDDKIMSSDYGALANCADVVATEKMDGECTTIHRGGCHARSVDGQHHPSRDWVKAFAAGVSHRLAADERIVGENLFARHSIGYDSLPTYFMGFAWIKNGWFQPWDDTIARFEELGVTPVPLLFRGPFSVNGIKGLCDSLDTARQEGLVVRVSSDFTENDMPRCIGKYVRAGHVQTDEHWMHAEVVRNGLA